jgi:hypothetical protein
MNETIAKFLHTKQIDSLIKLRILLFMHQNPDLAKTCRQLAEQLYLGQTPLLDNILLDLQQVGLIKCDEGQCMLSDEPEIKTGLQHLSQIFNDPLSRQKLLKRVKSYSANQPYPPKVSGYGED